METGPKHPPGLEVQPDDPGKSRTDNSCRLKIIKGDQDVVTGKGCMMRSCIRGFLFMALLLFIPAAGMAHSTAGLEKVTLRAWSVEVDDLAYYLEQYVGKRIDPDGKRYRYGIWEFDGLVQDGSGVRVQTLIYDQKTATKTPEGFYLQRNLSGTWSHLDADGDVIDKDIYTYVDPKARLAGWSVTAVLLAGIVVVLSLVRRRQRLKARG